MKISPKRIATLFLSFLLLVALAGAFDIIIESPNDNVVDLDGNLSTVNSFVCTATGSATTNVSNVTRWDNSTGAWVRNQSNLTSLATGGNVQNITFIPPKNFSDGFRFIWGCEVCVNGTNVAGGDFCQNATWTKFTNNRTFRVELPPNMTLEVPATANKSSSAEVFLNFTPRSDYIGNGNNNNLLDCRVWDNSSGTWTRSSLGITAVNNTTSSFPHTFAENNSISWNVECAERNEISVKSFAVSNFTTLIDTINPVVVLNTPASSSYDNDGTVLFNFTGTDRNIDSCSLYHNASGSYILNLTNKTSVVSGTPILATQKINNDGNVVFAAACNDTVGRNVFTSNNSFTVDTSGATILNASNFTVSNSCNEVGMTWNTSETRNGSVNYGLTVDLGTKATANTDTTTSHSANVNFGKSPETLFYVNLTSCDSAANCNTTAHTVTTPLSLCNEGGTNAGWNAFAILNNGSTLGSVANASGASLAYWWNATGQTWLFNQRLTSTNAGIPVEYGQAVLLYSATNTTWFRNTTATGLYHFNLTTGDNFLGITSSVTFWNFSQSLKNSSKGDSIPVHGDANLTNNTVFFANFNNSLHNYLSHYRGFSWENSTNLTRGEVVWTWVERFNVTWNGTAVYTNLSLIYG